MSDSDRSKALIEAMMGPPPPDFEARLAGLCRRLKIEVDPGAGWITWAMIGLRLAQEQPEFHRDWKPRARGRPTGRPIAQRDWEVIQEAMFLAHVSGESFEDCLTLELRRAGEAGKLPAAAPGTHRKRLMAVKKRLDAFSKELKRRTK